MKLRFATNDEYNRSTVRQEQITLVDAEEVVLGEDDIIEVAPLGPVATGQFLDMLIEMAMERVDSEHEATRSAVCK